jgi:hypothetical protein
VQAAGGLLYHAQVHVPAFWLNYVVWIRLEAAGVAVISSFHICTTELLDGPTALPPAAPFAFAVCLSFALIYYSSIVLLQVVQQGALQQLPKFVTDKLKTVEVASFLGLFTEINRSYMTYDNELFIWNYDNPTDQMWYRELCQPIRAVGLVVPKPDVFEAFVQACRVSIPCNRVYISAYSFSGCAMNRQCLSVPKFWTHRTKVYCFCDTSVREKAWRSRKRVVQAT